LGLRDSTSELAGLPGGFHHPPTLVNSREPPRDLLP